MNELGMTGRQFRTAIYQEIARIGKALADPHRLEILDMLAQAEKNVELLARETGMSISSTSHHLQILKEAKLVSDRRDGKFVHYHITPAGLRAWRDTAAIAEENLAEIRTLAGSFFNTEDDISEILYPEFMRKIMKGEIILLDVRPDYEYDAGHIHGALSVPLKELSDKLASFPRKKEIVAYCRGKYCVMAKDAVTILKKNGFQAFRLKDGVHEYHHKNH